MERRPNILWICTDQQRHDTIGALGCPVAQTHTLDRLVAEGTAFTRAYCQTPICTPSRSSFLTGRYPSSIRANRNGQECFPEGPTLVTRLLADAGYDCGLIGKLHLASACRRIEPRCDDGYRFWRYSHAPRDDWPEGHHYAEWVRAKGHSLNDLLKSPENVPAELHQTTWCAEETIAFIREPRAGPWLASVNMYDPHPPFNPPRSYLDRFDPGSMPGPLFRDNSDLAHQEKLATIDFQSRPRRPHELDLRNPLLKDAQNLGADARDLQAAYHAMIALIDDQVAHVLAALEETGQADHTLIVFMSDHGEALGDHGLIQKGCRFYEGLVRVPLILCWPGRFQSGLRSSALVELIDIAPTLLEAAGVAIPSEVQGRSLLPILTGKVDPSCHREFVRCEYLDSEDLPDGTRATMIRDERHKLVVYHGHGLGELYDLETDPGEFVDLWESSVHHQIKLDLMHRSFDAMVLGMDLGPRRIGPM